MSLRKKIIFCAVGAVLAAYVSKQAPAGLETRTSENGLALVTNAENCTLTPYKCAADKWTNGVGNTHGVDPLKSITMDQVVLDLRRNIKTAETCVNRYFKGDKLNQNQFDAMVSLVFNIGCENARTFYSLAQEKRVPTTLYKLAQAEQFNLMCLRIADFNRAGGKVLKGLQVRREQERRLCLGLGNK
ncbi:lysozyme [Aggregatibacter actinomycetemcomitans]|uniref:lysozyme n=1 Tax=Aggregatibacter actinomycetemcomitans TaxID=714 RepID=UPI00197C3EF7|nr:lysozyme [Aggregatibacter actinomycetemcomitans]MBN6067875.1 lysozyme [Aggregatibacter actinomycetemcomitans]MBN6085812.1 lysozyme [Aggregatibacter actinomycetemcomitans]